MDAAAEDSLSSKMLEELGLPATAASVAEHYRGLVDCFVLDEADATLVPAIAEQGMQVVTAPTIMKSLGDREALARRVLELGAGMAS